MNRYRAEAICTAFAIAACGIAMGTSIIVRCIFDAIDAAVTMPRHTELVPDTVPEWLNEEIDLP